MKKTVKKLLVPVIVLALALSMSAAAMVSAASINQGGKISLEMTVIQEIKNQIDDFLVSDGAYASLALDSLENSFFENPALFIRAVATYNADTSQRVAEAVGMHVASYGEEKQNDFETAISAALSGKLTETEIGIAETILNSFAEFDFIETDESSFVPGALFDVDTIKGFVDTYKELGYPRDDEFDVQLAKCYILDPALFSEVLAEYNATDIGIVAGKVASGYQRANLQIADSDISPAASEDSLSAGQQNVLDAIEAKLQSGGAPAINGAAASARAAVTPLTLTPAPTIGAMNYSGTITVGQPTTLSVVFTESALTASARSYYAEVINTRNGASYVKATKSISFPAGVSSKTETFSITFSNAGSFTTTVKVYSSQGGTLIRERTGASPDISHGKWRITVALRTDRTILGTLTLYDASGASQFSCPCLGRSLSGDAMNVYYGNTPIGPYTGQLGPVQSNSSSYGPYKVVKLTGAAGNVYDPAYRSGVWIHGGDPSPSGGLRATNGCVRISNANQYSLANDKITTMIQTNNGHDAIGNVQITQTA